MANKDYKAFIVEGEVREPNIIDNISKGFFLHGNYKVITLPAGENIYMLWKQLKADDFATWKEIIEVFAVRISCLYEMSDTMEYEQYSREVTPGEIYAMEVKEAEKQRVFILSAFPEFLLDYFGVRLWKTSVRHTKNQRDKCKVL